MVSTATLFLRSISLGKCMFGQHGTGLPLLRNVMNQLLLIRKSICKKNSLHNAELFLSSRPSHTSPIELNIRLLKKKAQRKLIHQSELNLASKCRSISFQLNSHLAQKKEHEKRLHSAQIISMKRWNQLEKQEKIGKHYLNRTAGLNIFSLDFFEVGSCRNFY